MLVIAFSYSISINCQTAELTSCILAPLLAPLLNLRDHPPFTCELAVDEREAAIHNATVRLIPVSSGTSFNTVVEFVSRRFSRHHSKHAVTGSHTGSDCSEVIGVVGDLDSKTASILHTLSSRANFSLTLVSAFAPSTFLPTTHLTLPGLLDMNPLTFYVEALVAFFDHLNWTRIGLISDTTQYFSFAAELLQQKLLENPGRAVIPFVRIGKRDNKSKAILTVKEYETDIVAILASDMIACSLIQETERLGLKWPGFYST